jgi:hypothetical protein
LTDIDSSSSPQAARLVKHPGADRDDQPVALGDRDEAHRRDDAVDRVVPAQERLDARDLPVVEGDHRLVDEPQLALVERLAQRPLQLQALDRLAAHRGVEDLAASLAELLGAVHGRIGVAQQRVRVDAFARRAAGDADARRDVARLALDDQRIAQGLGEPAGDAQRVVLADHAGQQHGELVAAEPRDDVVGAQAARQALGHRADQPVAGAVAERVVDDLEVVEVDEEHGDAPGAPAEIAGQALEEQLAVGQAGERVVVGLPGELLLGVAVLGDVDAVADPRPRRAIGAVEVRVAPQPPAAAVAIAQLELLPDRGEGAAREIAGEDEIRELAADRIAADALGQADVRALHDAVEPDERDADRRLLEGRAEALLGGGGEGAGVLVQAPVREVDGAERRDVGGVDRRPAPWVLDRGMVVVDRRGGEHAEDRVMGEDEGEREQVGEPLLVEGEHADDEEEVEVRLDRPVHEVHDHGRGAEQPDAGGRRPADPRQVRIRRDEGAEQQRRGVERRVPQRVVDHQAPREQHDGVGPEQPHHPGMPLPPQLGREGVATGKDRRQARYCSHGQVFDRPARFLYRRLSTRESSGRRLVTLSASRCSSRACA